MACFIVPAGEAIITTIATKVLEKKTGEKPAGIVPKMKWLNTMLWGGSALLAFEHVWHGEVVPWFPFLTAMDNAADTADMLAEMSTVGVTMAIVVTLAWGLIAAAATAAEKRAPAETEAS